MAEGLNTLKRRSKNSHKNYKKIVGFHGDFLGGFQQIGAKGPPKNPSKNQKNSF